MNDALPLALGFSSSLTESVIRGPYAYVPAEAQAPLRRALRWTAWSILALAASLLILLLV